MTTRARARRGEGERLRDEILEAADRILVASGDEEAVSLRAVAREVGCTAPAIYLHFTDRQALLFAVCERHFRDLDTAVVGAVAGIDDPLAALRAAGWAYVRWGIANPEPYRIIFMTRRADAPPWRFEGDSAGEVAFRHLAELVEWAMKEGAVRSDDPWLVATGVWAAVHGLTSLVISTPDFPAQGLDVVVDHLMDVYLRGLS